MYLLHLTLDQPGYETNVAPRLPICSNLRSSRIAQSVYNTFLGPNSCVITIAARRLAATSRYAYTNQLACICFRRICFNFRIYDTLKTFYKLRIVCYCMIVIAIEWILCFDGPQLYLCRRWPRRKHRQ